MSRKFQQIRKNIAKACQDPTITEAEVEKIFQENNFFVELAYEGFGKDILAQREALTTARIDTARAEQLARGNRIGGS